MTAAGPVLVTCAVNVAALMPSPWGEASRVTDEVGLRGVGAGRGGQTQGGEEGQEQGGGEARGYGSET